MGRWTSLSRVVLLAGPCMVAACATATRLEGRLASMEELLARAERQGASVCAPEELALGRAHVAFARDELGEGDYRRAEEHAAEADPNIRAALTLSPPGRCGEPKAGDRDRDGILDGRDRCPDAPEDFDGDADDDGCPDDADLDLDTVVDSRDLCAAEPEDLDGYLDTDGCPEPDNDLDTLEDGRDQCPSDPEDRDGHADDDGCPDLDNDADGLTDVDDRCPNEPGAAELGGCPREYKDVEVTATAIRITQKVYFDTAKATIRERSFGLLDTVAEVLRDMPAVTVEIQGHTDSQGNDRKNLTLSDKRAAAVRSYLVGRGVAPERMTARGYGEERPIDSNRTSAGREANRRVEFVRTDAGKETP